MRTRSRLLPGVLTLLALTLSFAEAVWASSCAMDMCAPVAVASSSAEDQAVPALQTHAGAQQDEDQPCPFGPLVALQGCTGAASLATEGVEIPTGSVVLRAQEFPVSAESGSPALDALFRPPRA